MKEPVSGYDVENISVALQNIAESLQKIAKFMEELSRYGIDVHEHHMHHRG